MRFAHISDLHLGFSQFGSEEREQDVYDAFNQAVSISIEKKADFAVLAGDLFNEPRPNGNAIMNMASCLKRLKDADIPAFFVLGEHDISRMSSYPVPFVYDKLGYASRLDGKTRYVKGVMIAGLNKMRKSEVQGGMPRLKELDKEAAGHDGHRILVMHQGISEAHRFADELSASDLPKNFTYYAMGHIHDRFEKKFGFLGGPLAYPGSIEVTSSEGTKEGPKGFYMVDISSKEAVPEWIELKIRPQMVIEATPEDLQAKVAEAIKEASAGEKKPIIKVSVSGQADPEEVRRQVSRLEEGSLHSSYRISQREDGAGVLLSRPDSIDEEMLKLASEALGSPELAAFAVKELLGPLAAGLDDDADRAVSDGFARHREGALQ